MEDAVAAVKLPKVSFKVITYWKRRRDEPGRTKLESCRLGLGAALDQILDELPREAITLTREHEEVVSIRIDWTKVPDEIRDGTI